MVAPSALGDLDHHRRHPTALEKLLTGIAIASVISFDTETTSTDEMTADLVGISLAVREGEG